MIFNSSVLTFSQVGGSAIFDISIDMNKYSEVTNKTIYLRYPVNKYNTKSYIAIVENSVSLLFLNESDSTSTTTPPPYSSRIYSYSNNLGVTIGFKFVVTDTNVKYIFGCTQLYVEN